MKVSTKQDRIARIARDDPDRVLTSLHHHIDIYWLAEAYRATRKDGACGIDGQTAEDYEKNLTENLKDLLERFKKGRYFAPPVKRVYIPKGNGEKRGLGIPTFEDKVLQRACTMLLEPIYEQNFLNCSFGFRPRRSQHQAIKEIRGRVMELYGCWVIDADIRKYFDTLDHAQLRDILDLRVRDGVVRRVMHKWLKAGVMENGAVTYSDVGTPQGGVISPMLSNIYLHEVLDKWFEYQIKPLLQGRAYLVRFADDFVMMFEHEHDARRVYKTLFKRFEKYGLTIHPEKTRLFYFGPPRDNGERTAFDFLGFTHYWGKSRKGSWVVKRKTASVKMAKALKTISEWCRSQRHQKIKWQWQKLCLKLKGHYGYYGITCNWQSSANYLHQVKRVWRKWLDRRTRQRGNMSWARFEGILQTYPLPPPRIVHSGV
jgi:group II intron reverse transcriptase/maturase